MPKKPTTNTKDELLHYHTIEHCEEAISFWNRLICRWLIFFKRHKRFVISCDHNEYSKCIIQRNKFRRLLKLRQEKDKQYAISKTPAG